MKTKIYLAILLAGLSINCTKAQISSTDNFGGSTDYVGWDAFQTFPLTIKHERANQPINFYTNTGANVTPLAKLRMEITNDILTAGNGTNNYEVGRVSIRESSLLWSLAGAKPGALLHLGHGIVPGSLGHRNWMDVGTYTAAQTDNMYFGLKQEFVSSNSSQIWTDQMDAVISWGDNASTNSDNLNDLRFIFTTVPGTNGTSGLYDGQEMARISYEGNFGIGNFYKLGSPTNTALRPARRLEVLDGGRNQPQFRLTSLQQNGAGTGVYTDFQTTNIGNLFIDPRFGSSETNVGIGTSAPTAKLHVTGQNIGGNIIAQKIDNLQATATGFNKALEINAGGGSSTTGININLSNATVSSGMYIDNGSSNTTTNGLTYGINYAQRVGTNNQKNFGFSAIVNATGEGDYKAFNKGIFTEVSNNSEFNYGGDFHALGNTDDVINYGVYSEAKPVSMGNNIKNTGVHGRATSTDGGNTNYGVYGYANGGDINYGIIGVATPGNCSNTSCAQAAGYFDGDLFHSGAIYTSSDLKLKKNINNLQNANAILQQLSPKTYDFDLTSFPGMNLSSGQQYGLIAQDVEVVLPSFVKNFISIEKYDDKGMLINPTVDFKAVNYEGFIPILIQAVKEQQAEIDSLKAILVSNARQINIQPNSTINKEKVELSDNLGIILDQNDPNPFTESTTINFVIPESVKEAKILFINNAGVVLRSLNLQQRGVGSLDVYASELSSGVYTYTLIADGKIIDSKKMMKK